MSPRLVQLVLTLQNKAVPRKGLEAEQIMAGGGIDNKWLDREKIKDRGLASSEIDDLVAFLGALECPGKLEMPELP